MRYLLAFAGALTITPALAATAALKASAWSEITGERFSHSTLNRSGTVIKMIDGHPASERKPRVPSGQHTLTVQWIPKKGLRNSERTLRVDTKPCKRYYVNAQFSSPSSALWQPVVDKVEDIPGCTLAPAVANVAPAPRSTSGK